LAKRCKKAKTVIDENGMVASFSGPDQFGRLVICLIGFGLLGENGQPANTRGWLALPLKQARDAKIGGARKDLRHEIGIIDGLSPHFVGSFGC
jgi:hypothetical protein